MEKRLTWQVAARIWLRLNDKAHLPRWACAVQPLRSFVRGASEYLVVCSPVLARQLDAALVGHNGGASAAFDVPTSLLGENLVISSGAESNDITLAPCFKHVFPTPTGRQFV